MEPSETSIGKLTETASETTKPVVQRGFELILWNSRFFIVIPVFASMCVAIAMFYAATVDTVLNWHDIQSYTTPSPLPFVHDALRTHLIAHVVEAIDGYLLGVVMLIFAMGMYELFVSKIGPAQKSDRARGILVVHSFDDLKTRLGQVIMLILIVKFFEGALSLPYESATELAKLAGSIVLIGLALFLTGRSEK